MGIEIKELGNGFAGEASGVDIRRTLTPDEVASIDEGMNRYGILVFHDQEITDEQQVAFSVRFGRLEPAVGGNVTPANQRRLSIDLADVSNLSEKHEPLARDDRRRLFNLGNQLWHSDSSFRAIPAKYSILSARQIPAGPGGNTEFADMRAAYDALDAEMKALVEDLVCEHSLMVSRGLLGQTDWSEEEKKTFAPVRQRFVRTHPVTGRKSLYLSSHAGSILGWPVPEARALLRDLTEHATQPRFVHVHQWRRWDLVMWDNRVTMHRVRRFDDRQVRDMRRTTLSAEAPTVEQVQAA